MKCASPYAVCVLVLQHEGRATRSGGEEHLWNARWILLARIQSLRIIQRERHLRLLASTTSAHVWTQAPQKRPMRPCGHM